MSYMLNMKCVCRIAYAIAYTIYSYTAYIMSILYISHIFMQYIQNAYI